MQINSSNRPPHEHQHPSHNGSTNAKTSVSENGDSMEGDCPICGAFLPTDLDAIQLHIESCLDKNERKSVTPSPHGSKKRMEEDDGGRRKTKRVRVDETRDELSSDRKLISRDEMHEEEVHHVECPVCFDTFPGDDQDVLEEHLVGCLSQKRTEEKMSDQELFSSDEDQTENRTDHTHVRRSSEKSRMKKKEFVECPVCFDRIPDDSQKILEEHLVECLSKQKAAKKSVKNLGQRKSFWSTSKIGTYQSVGPSQPKLQNQANYRGAPEISDLEADSAECPFCFISLPLNE
jgi:hypothetical protein